MLRTHLRIAMLWFLCILKNSTFPTHLKDTKTQSQIEDIIINDEGDIINGVEEYDEDGGIVGEPQDSIISLHQVEDASIGEYTGVSTDETTDEPVGGNSQVLEPLLDISNALENLQMEDDLNDEVFDGGVLPKKGEKVQYRVMSDGDWKSATIISRGGKATGKYSKHLNVLMRATTLMSV